MPISYRAPVISGLRCLSETVLLTCVVVGGLPITSGCSYLFVTPPMTETSGLQFAGDCTSNGTAPVIDTLLTSTNVFSTLYVAGERNVTNKPQAIGVGLAASAFWLSSAIYGYYNTSRCSALRDGEDGPYHRPVRVRRTVLSGPRQTMPPAPLAPPPPPAPALAPTPSSPPPAPYPPEGAGGAGGMAGPTAPASAVPAVPPVRQQLDDDDPGTSSSRRQLPAAPAQAPAPIPARVRPASR
jgi:hypothetical protein